MGRKTWSECVKLYEYLQKDQSDEILHQVQSLDAVNFCDFISSFDSINEEKRNEEARAVHKVLKISKHDKTAKFCTETDSGEYDGCNLGEVHLKLLLGVFTGVKLTKLDVSRNRKLLPGGWLLIGKIIEKSGLMELEAQYCGLKSQHLEKLMEGMNGAKLTKLDMRYNKGLKPGGCFLVGKIIKQSGSMKLDATSCDLTSQELEELMKGMESAKLTELYVSLNPRITLEGWFALGKLVNKNGLKTLLARSSVTNSDSVEKLVEGMDGAKLDRLDMRINFGHDSPSFTSSLLKLLPLINENLNLSGWKINEKEQETLQRKLDEEQLTTLVIKFDNVKLMAEPVDFPTSQFTRELSFVDNVTAKQDGDGILVTWDPLDDYDGLHYYIEIKSEGRRVEEPVMCTNTEYRMCSIQPKTKYYFCVWGFTDNSVSDSVSWSKHETGDISLDAQNQNQGFDCSNTETNSTKRPNQDNAVEENVCRPKKAKLLQSWRWQSESSTHDFSSESRQNPHSSSHFTSQRNHVPSASAEPAAGSPTLTDVSAGGANNTAMQRFLTPQTTENYLSVPAMDSSQRNEPRYLSEPGQNQATTTSYNAGISSSSRPDDVYGMADPSTASDLYTHGPASNAEDEASWIQFLTGGHTNTSATMEGPVFPLRTVWNENSSTYITTHPSTSVNPANQRVLDIFSPSVQDSTLTSTDQSHVFTDHQRTIEYRMANLESMMNNLRQENLILHESLENQQKTIADLTKDNTAQKQDIDALNISLTKQEDIDALKQDIANLKEENVTQQREIANLKELAEESKQPIQAGDPDQIKDFILPMKSTEDVVKNEKLLEDRENARKLVSYLVTLGGTKKKDVIWAIMGKLFTNELGTTYSWEGRKGKKAFGKLKMADVIKESSKKNKKVSFTDEKAQKSVMNWLKNAVDRGGGRKEREERRRDKELKDAEAGTSS